MESLLPLKTKMFTATSSQVNRDEESGRVHYSAPFVYLINTFVCTLVALVSWLLGSPSDAADLFVNWVYSNFIGQTICTGFLLLSYFKQRMPEFPFLVTVLLHPFIILFGFFAGTLGAAFLLGHSTGLDKFENVLRSSLLITVLVSIGSLVYYHSRERVAYLKLQAAEDSARASANRLSMLQAQVEPHMLFNTLSNLRSLIGTDPVRAQYMLDQLVEFLRATLTGSQSSTASLASEFKLLENYLSLMKIRLGDRLSFELDLPKTLDDIQVPALIIQPLVENAIKHGIEPSKSGGLIQVTAQSVDSLLAINVTDTGIGFVQQEDGLSLGFGLHSVRERLQPLESELENLSIESPPANYPTGTAITMRLPLVRHTPNKALPT